MIPNKIEAILFDLDGTLIDTDDLVVDALARRLRPVFGNRANGLARSLLMNSEGFGTLMVTIMDYFGLDEPLMSLTDKLRRRRGVFPAEEFQLIPGVEDMILRLSGQYKLGIVTTRSRYHINKFREIFPTIGGSFEVTCGLQDTRRLKPNPEPVLAAAGRLKVPVDRCMMVGDTSVDVKAARRAGAWAVGVLCGFGDRSDLERAGAHLILDSTADILNQLDDF